MGRIVIVNRYYPPNPAISGQSACEMAQELSNRMHKPKLLIRYVQAPYAGGQSNQAPVGTLGPLSSIYNGKNKMLRFIGNFIEGYRLIRQSLPHADAIISLTDPPMLHFWAGILCHSRKIPWINWALDLYPEAFSAAGIVSKKNLIYQGFQRSIKSFSPDFIIALGEQQASYLKAKFQKDIPTAILPCGIYKSTKASSIPEWKSNGKHVFAYAGNMGEAHDPEFLIQLIQRLDPQKHVCLLSLYGIKAPQVLTVIKDHPAVRVLDHIPQEYLPHIDVHLVSLLPEWTHVCVPSKAVSAICAGRAIAFQGESHADTWQMFQNAGFHISHSQFPQKMGDDLSSMLNLMDKSEILHEKFQEANNHRNNLLRIRNNAYESIVAFLEKKI
ncbi:colanic acid biosynthesis glycosyl transferase [Candidatus Magnetomorum sp. HK-1]|nr:colanic acid biosynthesis glycosyl transferase [Candidatus Magnetomorum sp. HK-1]